MSVQVGGSPTLNSDSLPRRTRTPYFDQYPDRKVAIVVKNVEDTTAGGSLKDKERERAGTVEYEGQQQWDDTASSSYRDSPSTSTAAVSPSRSASYRLNKSPSLGIRDSSDSPSSSPSLPTRTRSGSRSTSQSPTLNRSSSSIGLVEGRRAPLLPNNSPPTSRRKELSASGSKDRPRSSNFPPSSSAGRSPSASTSHLRAATAPSSPDPLFADLFAGPRPTELRFSSAAGDYIPLNGAKATSVSEMDGLVDGMKAGGSLSERSRGKRKGLLEVNTEDWSYEDGGGRMRSRQSTSDSARSAASSTSFASMTAGPSADQLLYEGGGLFSPSASDMVRSNTLRPSRSASHSQASEEDQGEGLAADANLAIRLADDTDEGSRTSPPINLDALIKTYYTDVAPPPTRSSSLNASARHTPPTSALRSLPTSRPSSTDFHSSPSSTTPPSKTHIKSIDEIIRQHAIPSSLASKSSTSPSLQTPAQALAASARSGVRVAELSHEPDYSSSAENSPRHSIDSVEEEIKASLRAAKERETRSANSSPSLHHSRSFPNRFRPTSPSHDFPSSLSPSTNSKDRPNIRSARSSSTSVHTVGGGRPGSAAGPSLESDEFAVERELARLLRQPRLTRLLTLKRSPNQNMTVSLADVGSPTGHPVIVFLGLGCVRYLVALYDEIAEAFGLRLICVDRWGLGRTSPVPDDKRGFMEWAIVFNEVVDELGLDSYTLLAHSAGGPYALAASLRIPERVHGSIHLLAPWVSTSADSLAGPYKYLKYVPTGVIKTAQAAEFKMQAWRLGKPPTIVHDPVEFNHRAPVSSSDMVAVCSEEEVEVGGGGEASSEACNSDYSSSQNLTSGGGQYPLGRVAVNGRPLKPKRSKSFLGGMFGGSSTGERTPKSSPSPSRVPSRTFSTPPSTLSVDSNATPPASANKGSRSRKTSISSLASSMRRTPPPPLPPQHTQSSSSTLNTDYPSSLSSPTATVSPMGPNISSLTSTELANGLLRASYSESLKGTTSDLMVLLERTSKPWAFKYSDVHTPVKIWQGEKDERISLSSIKSLGKQLKDCRMALVEGADHSLMTNGQVMIEVLESIAEEWANDRGATTSSTNSNT